MVPYTFFAQDQVHAVECQQYFPLVIACRQQQQRAAQISSIEETLK